MVFARESRATVSLHNYPCYQGFFDLVNRGLKVMLSLYPHFYDNASIALLACGKCVRLICNIVLYMPYMASSFGRISMEPLIK